MQGTKWAKEVETKIERKRKEWQGTNHNNTNHMGHLPSVSSSPCIGVGVSVAAAATAGGCKGFLCSCGCVAIMRWNDNRMALAFQNAEKERRAQLSRNLHAQWVKWMWIWIFISTSVQIIKCTDFVYKHLGHTASVSKVYFRMYISFDPNMHKYLLSGNEIFLYDIMSEKIYHEILNWGKLGLIYPDKMNYRKILTYSMHVLMYSWLVA